MTAARLSVTDLAFLVHETISLYCRRANPVRLVDRRGGTLMLDIRTDFSIVPAAEHHGDQKFVTLLQSYEYRLLDRLERELLVYHWQPGPRYAGPDSPHLHVSASLRAMTSAVDEREIDLDKLHLLTGHVTLTSVVRSLVTEFGVEPLRPDWARVLDDAETGELAATVRAG